MASSPKRQKPKKNAIADDDQIEITMNSSRIMNLNDGEGPVTLVKDVCYTIPGKMARLFINKRWASLGHEYRNPEYQRIGIEGMARYGKKKLRGHVPASGTTRKERKMKLKREIKE